MPGKLGQLGLLSLEGGHWLPQHSADWSGHKLARAQRGEPTRAAVGAGSEDVRAVMQNESKLDSVSSSYMKNPK